MRSVFPALGLAIAAAAAPLAAAVPAPPPETDAIPVILLVDLNSGQTLAARHPDLRFVPASMAKVMTIYTALGLIHRGELDPRRRFAVDQATAQAWNGKGTSLYLQAGDTPTTEELIHGIATVSANDAAMVLAQGVSGSVAAWAARMNANARTLGMHDSRFANPSGWPDGGQTYVSARDLTKLAAALISTYPADYRRYFGQRTFDWNGVALRSHDPATGFVPGADGIKTGHTDEAGYNFLGSAEREGRRLVMVVAGAKSEAERAAASRALLEWGYAAWRAQPLFAPGATVGTVRVQNGASREVPLVSVRRTFAAYPAGQAPNVRLAIRYNGPLVAPLAKGAHVADLVIDTGSSAPGTIPLYTAAAVPVAGRLDRLINGIAGVFGL